MSTEPTVPLGVPPELFHHITQYLDYPDWLSLYYSYPRRFHEYIRRAPVGRMEIFASASVGPVPHFIDRLVFFGNMEDANSEDTVLSTALRRSRRLLFHVLSEAVAIRHMQFDFLEYDRELSNAIRLHGGALRTLAFKFKTKECLVELLTGLESLQELDLSFSEYFEGGVPKDFLEGISLPRLSRLQLDNCGIKEIAAGAFRSLSSLTSLDLGSNSISTLPSHLFYSLPRLRELSLACNDLDYLSPEHFEGAMCLESLRIYGTRISNIAPGTFGGLKSLRSIVLMDADLVSPPALGDILYKLTPLGLDLEGSRITLYKYAHYCYSIELFPDGRLPQTEYIDRTRRRSRVR